MIKNNIKACVIFILAILFNQTYAQEILGIKNEIERNAQEQVNLVLKRINSENFFAKVYVDFNDDAIQSYLKNKKIVESKTVLPGLDVVSSTKFSSTQIQAADIYEYITGMKVTLYTPEVLSDEQKKEFESFIKDTFKFYPHFNQITFDYQKSALVHRSIILENKENEFDWSLISLLAILLVAVIFFSQKLSNSLQNGFASINNSLKNIDISIPDFSNPTPNKTQDTSMSKKSTQTDDLETSYLIDQVRKYLVDEKDKIEILYDKVLSGNISFLSIAIGLVDKDLRNKILATLPKKIIENYAQYITQSDKTIDFDDLEKLYRSLKIFQLEPGLLIEQEVKSLVKDLDLNSINKLLNDLNSKELSFLIEYADKINLAMSLSQNTTVIEKLDAIPTTVDLNDKELITFKNTILKTLTHKKNDSSDISDFLPENVEIILSQKRGIEEISWHKLEVDQVNSILSYVKSLSTADIAAFISIAPRKLGEKLITELPEIKKEQLSKFGTDLTARSFELKHRIFSKIKNESWV